jgi:hypothetical protein
VEIATNSQSVAANADLTASSWMVGSRCGSIRSAVIETPYANGIDAYSVDVNDAAVHPTASVGGFSLAWYEFLTKDSQQTASKA